MKFLKEIERNEKKPTVDRPKSYSIGLKLWLYAFLCLQFPVVIVGLVIVGPAGGEWILASAIAGLGAWAFLAWHLTRPLRISVDALRRYRSTQEVVPLPEGPDDSDGLLNETREVIETLARAFRESSTDPLTGAFNRRYAQARLTEELVRAKRVGTPLTVLFVDIDGFKEVNDHYGHPAGDACLRHLVNVIREQVRDGDWVVRWGGDEFLIVLWNSDVNAGRTVSRRMYEALRSEPIALGGTDQHLSISTGLAEAEPEDDAESLLSRVDDALYGAKRAGKGDLSIGRAAN